MSYSVELAHRISTLLKERTSYVEKQMFGGVAYMVDDKMCVGISRDTRSDEDRLMARVGPGFHEEALKRQGCREMDFVGRPMIGFVFVYAEGYTDDADLLFWINKTLEFNKVAPPKPPKKKLVTTKGPLVKGVVKEKPKPVAPKAAAVKKKSAPVKKPKKTAAKKKKPTLK